ncbi:tetratricopeptide repeat protein [Candidatus Saccharibacteria bacterium]|nr:tetratricopeptide repeat protein [Candidatus Saccharibacteria bacterium]
MIAVLSIMFFTLYLSFFFPLESRSKKKEASRSPKYSAQMKKLWQIAQTSMKERKPFRAEKALLTILKFDEKNAAAYNRLGILYAKDKRYDEAVECFEIAQSLDNNPASIHNAGLIYYETGAYEKAEMAFSQAISLEGDVPSRYIALARAQEKLGKPRKAIESLENAYELDPKVTILSQMKTIYEGMDDLEGATAINARIEEQIARENELKREKATSRALKAMQANKRERGLSKVGRKKVAGLVRGGGSRNARTVSAQVDDMGASKTGAMVSSARGGAKKILRKDGRANTRLGQNTSSAAVVVGGSHNARSMRKTSNAQVVKPHAGRKRI